MLSADKVHPSLVSSKIKIILKILCLLLRMNLGHSSTCLNHLGSFVASFFFLLFFFFASTLIPRRFNDSIRSRPQRGHQGADTPNFHKPHQMIFVICLEDYVPIASCCSKQGSEISGSDIYNLKPLIKINMMNYVSTSEELHNGSRAGSKGQASKENCIYHSRIKEHVTLSFQRGGKMDCECREHSKA